MCHARLPGFDKQKVAAVMAGFSNIGILGRLVGVQHNRASDFVEQQGAVHYASVFLECFQEGLCKYGMHPAAIISYRFIAAGGENGAGLFPRYPG